MARKADVTRVIIREGRRTTLTKKGDFLPEDVLMVLMKHHILEQRSVGEIAPAVIDRSTKSLLVFGE